MNTEPEVSRSLGGCTVPKDKTSQALTTSEDLIVQSLPCNKPVPQIPLKSFTQLISFSLEQGIHPSKASLTSCQVNRAAAHTYSQACNALSTRLLRHELALTIALGLLS